MRNNPASPLLYISFYELIKSAIRSRTSKNTSTFTGVPRTELWLVDRGRYIGRGTIRHIKSGSDPKIKSNFYYEIASEFRGHGYGYALLLLLLQRAKELAIQSPIITVDADNLPSVKIIERAGCKFIETVVVGDCVEVRRYKAL
jgi:predicted acetyltransferase